MLTPVSEDPDYDKELVEAREKTNGYIDTNHSIGFSDGEGNPIKVGIGWDSYEQSGGII